MSNKRGVPKQTHGMSGTAVYRCWSNMLQRCTNPRHPQYKHYGARGISVCDRWSTFENFYADMGNPPAGTTLDRIDNEAGYSPTNCRWATWSAQQANKRPTSRKVQTHCKNGHPYTTQTAIRDSRGWLRCKTCSTEAVRRYYQRTRRASSARA